MSLQFRAGIILSATFGFVISANAGTSASSPRTHCIRQHLLEAIELNQARRPEYAGLTQGKSKAVSDALIASERVILVGSVFFDQAALAYQKAGIPIFCDDFVSMREVPTLVREIRSAEPVPKTLNSGFYEKTAGELRQALGAGGFRSLALRADDALHELERHPAYFCMGRHLLESIRRSSQLAPAYIEAASRQKLRSPEKLLQRWLKSQIVAFKGSLKIDRPAAEIQQAGIPIVCQDVPFVPPYSRR